MSSPSPSLQSSELHIGPAVFDGFVRAEGSQVVDAHGRPRLLRGVGLGNWMLPEGYMWGFGPGAESPREIEALIERLIGAPAADDFWSRFRDRYITESDIARMAELGFDHVRLPINARVVQYDDGSPRESGYRMIDDLIGWCRRHGLWIVLDLHGAPGGQTGTNIDDSPRGLPELFMDEGYRERTMALWRQLASRYAHETVILGYDLLNEPLPNEWQHTYADDLVALYRDLTVAIREIDPDHLIIYEGSHWATNWSMFTEVWDENSMLQFHKYWSTPDTASIREFLDVGTTLGLPIYMGEGGENTPEWIYTAFRLYESHGIGWNFWPWKKVATRTSPASIVAPDGWDRIVAATRDSTVVVEGAAQIIEELLDAMVLDACQWQPHIIDSLLGEGTRRIPAWGFGHRGPGVSSFTAPFDGEPVARREDGVDIAFRAGGRVGPENPFHQSDGRPFAADEVLVVHLRAGDRLEYEVRGVDASAARVVLDGVAVGGCRVIASDRGFLLHADVDVIFEAIEFDADPPVAIFGAR